MDTVTFAQKIKEKYPQYQNTDDITLVNKIIEKYPQYKTQIIDLPKVEAQPTETGLQKAEEIVTDPLKTLVARPGVRTGQALGAGGLLLADKITGGKVNEAILKRTGQTLAERLGEIAGRDIQTPGGMNIEGVKAFGEGGGRQIIGEAAQSASYIAPAGGVGAGLAKQTAIGAGTGYLADIGQGLTDENQTVGQALTPGLGTAIGAVVPGAVAGGVAGAKLGKKAVGELATAGGNALDMVTPKSENIMNRVARLKPTDAVKFQDMAGMTHGEYLSKTGNFARPDEIVKSEAKKFVASLNEVDNAMEKLPGKYQPAELKDVLEMLVEKETRVKSPDLKKVVELQNSYINGGLDMKQINEAKRLFERKVKLGYNKLMNPDMVELATNVDKRLRDWQFKQAEQLGLQNLGELNKQTQISKFIVDKLGQQLTGKTGLNGLELTDAVLLSGANPAAVAGFITRKVFADPGVQAKIAKMLSSGETQGFKKAIIGETKLPRLNPGKDGQIPTVSSGSTIPVAPKGSKMEFTGQKGGITPKSYDLNANTATTTKNTIKKGISKELPKTVKKSSNLSTLEQEAKKYKSADEFVKAQGTPVYHGGTKIDEVGNMKSKWGAFYMTDNPTYAKSYGGNKSVLNEMVITPKAKLADLIKPSDDLIKQIDEIISPKATGETIKIKKPDGSFVEVPKTKGGLSNPVHSSADIIQGIKDGKAYYAEMPEVKEALKKLGYDGMITQESKFGANYGVWNKDVIKTKSQLTDIWKKANKK